MIERFEENKIGNDYVVGDIHGCFGMLRERLTAIGFDESKDRLFSVGDLVDRGPDSEECVQWLDQPWFHAVRGNHEQMAINFTNGQNSALLYEQNGGRWFIDLDDNEQQAYAAMFNKLPLAIEVATGHGTVGIVHAEVVAHDWDYTIANISDNRTREYLLWARRKIDMRNRTHVKGINRVYVGHSGVKDITRLGNVHYIDGGAVFRGGKLIVVNMTEDMEIDYDNEDI